MPVSGSLKLLPALIFLSIAGPAISQDQKPAGYGPSPTLPKPQESWIPTINIAPADRWKEGQTPKAADGLAVVAYAKGLEHPRWLYVLPNGDVLVAQSNKPKTREEGGRSGIRGWVQGLVQKRAGAGVESPDRITLLRDTDGDGVAEMQKPFATGLTSPFGMALVGNTLYVANADALVSFAYADGQTEMNGEPKKVADLPAGINHHWTKGLVASRDGSKLYVSVGSNSNIGENGLEKEENRAAILEIDAASGATRLFGSGLRNPVGMAWEPQSGALWTVVNERDELGNDLVPDYLTSVKDGAFYGWPYSYFGQHVDTRVAPQKPDMVAKAVVPDYALGAHTASLGLTFSEGAKLLPQQFANGAIVGQHGSWNRKPLAGYKVIFVPFADGKPSGDPVDVLSGFVNAEGYANGRPVGVAIDKRGALLVADDVGNTIWRVTGAGDQAAPASEAGAATGASEGSPKP
jgi:glucose/arabinose dehydrogenase